MSTHGRCYAHTRWSHFGGSHFEAQSVTSMGDSHYELHSVFSHYEVRSVTVTVDFTFTL